MRRNRLIALMYENHAAREDTIVFPAWKTALSKHQLDGLGDKFEDIEKQQFGTDGYAALVGRLCYCLPARRVHVGELFEGLASLCAS